eukprot:TRINITY_DN4225_c0_g1_i5.p1 TRINITY_DN4225_c0_g1~~TRINITY_DN4225_c0_g1_i5.p1  ORF type:complete len:238 (+),score=40.48 TRINITY_DN4225_c0_g1_i5:93-806(+)
MKQQNNNSIKSSSAIRLTWTHKFLNKKYWHPQNPRNLEKKWLAEEKERKEKLKNEQATEQLQKEQKQWDQIQQLDQKGQPVVNVQKHSVAFLYMKPPGYIEEQNVKKSEESNEEFQGDGQKFSERKWTATKTSPLLEGYMWSKKRIPGDRAPRGGYSPSHPNQQLLLPSKEEQEEEEEKDARIFVKKSLKRDAASGFKLLQLSKLDRQKLKKIVKREIKKRKSYNKNAADDDVSTCI